MKKTLKMIQVEEDTHIQAKAQADKRGMLLRSYVKMLIERDGRALSRAEEKQ